ncbi:hypothetical protein GCM10027187_06570 [Streptosporangium sandarakinum]
MLDAQYLAVADEVELEARRARVDGEHRPVCGGHGLRVPGPDRGKRPPGPGRTPARTGADAGRAGAGAGMDAGADRGGRPGLTGADDRVTILLPGCGGSGPGSIELCPARAYGGRSGYPSLHAP